jgi:hypothetical protein
VFLFEHAVKEVLSAIHELFTFRVDVFVDLYKYLWYKYVVRLTPTVPSGSPE